MEPRLSPPQVHGDDGERKHRAKTQHPLGTLLEVWCELAGRVRVSTSQRSSNAATAKETRKQPETQRHLRNPTV